MLVINDVGKLAVIESMPVNAVHTLAVLPISKNFTLGSAMCATAVTPV